MQQWMECLVHIFTTENHAIAVNLVMKIESGEVIIEFWNDKELITKDRLFQYNSLRLDEVDQKKCTLQSASLNRIIIFQKEPDLSKFLSLLSKHGILTPLTFDQYSFVISRPPNGQINLFDIVGAIRNTFKGENENYKARPVDGFIYGTIEPQLPSSQLARFTIEDAKTAKLESLLFSTLQIPIESYSIIISRLLKVENINDKMSDLMKLKKQWELITSAEWKHNCDLRIFVHDVEEWIERNHRLYSFESHCKLLFNIAITLFTDKFGSLKFSNQLMFIIRLVSYVFISDNAKEDNFIANNGEGLTFEEAENMIYWHVKSLWQKLNESKNSPLQESLSIRTALSGISSSTLEMLNDRGLTSLDFSFQDADIFFSSGKKRSEMLMMLTAAIASNDFNGFRKNGIIASLVLLQERLQTINDVGLFSNSYSIELRKLDSRLLLYNIERLFASENH